MVGCCGLHLRGKEGRLRPNRMGPLLTLTKTASANQLDRKETIHEITLKNTKKFGDISWIV